MNKFAKKGCVRFLLLTCSLLVLSACATNRGAETSVEKRVTERWDLLLGGDLAGAYSYLSPAYRSSVSSIQYQRSILLKRVKWTDATHVSSDCIENTCKVKISLGYALYGAVPGVKEFNGKQTVTESWVLVNDVWYLVPKD